MSQDTPRALNGPGDAEFFLSGTPSSAPQPHPSPPIPLVGSLRISRPPSTNTTAVPTSLRPPSGLSSHHSSQPGSNRHSSNPSPVPAPLQSFPVPSHAQPPRPRPGFGRDSVVAAAAAAEAGYAQAGETLRRAKSPDYDRLTGDISAPPGSGPGSPAPLGAPPGRRMHSANVPQSGVTRISSTASTSTIRAHRGSPPPPETPITGPTASTAFASAPGGGPGGGIEARFANVMGGAGAGAAPGPSDPSAMTSFPPPPGPQSAPAPAPARPWTPTEGPDSKHGPPTVYQGDTAIENPPETHHQDSHPSRPAVRPEHPLEAALNRLSVGVDEPPPEYSTIAAQPDQQARSDSGYVDEKAALQKQQQQQFQQQRESSRLRPEDKPKFPPPGGAAAGAAAVTAAALAGAGAVTSAAMGAAAASSSAAQQVHTPPQAHSFPAPEGNQHQDLGHPAFGQPPPQVGPSPSHTPSFSSIPAPAQPQQASYPAAGLGAGFGSGLGAFAPGSAAPSIAGQTPMTSGFPLSSGPGNIVPQTITSPIQSALPTSPPPLPEGWIAHMDLSSGQYYYIHLATQSTQWEFPKGPNPMNYKEAPMSPGAMSSFGGAGPMSPGGMSTYKAPMSPAMSQFGGGPMSPAMSQFGGPMSPAMSHFGGPMSPAMSQFGGPLSPGAMSGFPGMVPMSPAKSAFGDSIAGVAGLAPPPTYNGPPPTSGVELYKVQATNGVYFGPYLRYTNMDIEKGLWLGSLLLVTDSPQPPTIHIHKSMDLSPNPRQLKPNPIYTHQRWVFYRYDIDLVMDEEGSTKWTYAVTSHLGCTRYEFVVAGRYETGWRFIAHSGNDFSLSISAEERVKMGGTDLMWRDVLQKHVECNGFHVQLGLGNQIFADRMWKEVPLLKHWTAMSGKENRKNHPWTAQHADEVTHAYFHYYTSHFDQAHIREAFAQIPHVLSVDSHDIFDGFGSYPEHMQKSQMFKHIGQIGIEMYLLFQHHTTLEILRNVANDLDLFSITGTGWHFVKYLGPAIVAVGPDTRSERTQTQVIAGASYQGIFPKIAMLPQSVQHCIWMVPVPVVYPRMESMEHFAQTVATGKKAVTGTFNILGKVTSSVAGVVGARGVVGDGFNSVKKAVGKSGLMSNVLSPFGEIDIMDDLRDQWTHDSKDLERTYLVRTLQGIAKNKSIRMSFFSGYSNCCGAGLLHDPNQQQDHKTMYQVISSAIVNGPPSTYMMRLLHSTKELYVPANGHKSNHQPSDTKEDMLEIFATDVNGQGRDHRKLMPRRNYVACVAFDPQLLQQQHQMQAGGGSVLGSPISLQQQQYPGLFGNSPTHMAAGNYMIGAQKLPMAGLSGGVGGDAGVGPSSSTDPALGGRTESRLSIAIDFLVQGDVQGMPVKYGPLVIPSVAFGS